MPAALPPAPEAASGLCARNTVGWLAAVAVAGVRSVAPDTGTNWTEDCVAAVSLIAVVVVPTVRGCEVGAATAVGARM